MINNFDFPITLVINFFIDHTEIASWHLIHGNGWVVTSRTLINSVLPTEIFKTKNLCLHSTYKTKFIFFSAHPKKRISRVCAFSKYSSIKIMFNLSSLSQSVDEPENEEARALITENVDGKTPTVDPDDDPLNKAMSIIANVSKEMVERLQKAKERKKLMKEKRATEPRTEVCTVYTIHDAVKSSDINFIKQFIDAGADLNVRDVWHNTVLHCAVATENREIIELVLNAKADLNAKDGHGCAALSNAYKRDNTDIVKLLIERGADVNIRDFKGQTILHEAVNKGKLEMVQYLMAHGADVNARDCDEWTPLHFAFSNLVIYSVEIVRCLIRNGADANARDNGGWTPLRLMLQKANEMNARMDRKKMFLRFLLPLSDVNDVELSAKIILNVHMNIELVKVILEHLAKMQALGFYIRTDILDRISYYDNYKNYFEKCTEELNAAKGIKLRNSWVTFFDFLGKSKKRLKNYAGNQDLVEDFKNTNFREKFPIYGVYMRKNMWKGIKIRKVFDKATVMLSQVCPKFNPAHMIIREILNCLTKKDWLKLCENI